MTSISEKIESNTRDAKFHAQRTAIYSELMTRQLAVLLDVSEDSLNVQHQQLEVQSEIRWFTEQQLDVQRQQLEVNEEQLAQAIKVVQRLDLTNEKLTQIEGTLSDISSVLVQQNVLIQKSFNRLANDAQELIQRGIIAHDNEWFEDATKDFEAALEKDHYSPVSHYYLGKCYRQLGKSNESNQSYKKCMFFAPKAAPVFHFLALCDLANHSISSKQNEEARRLLDEASKCTEQDRMLYVSTLLSLDLSDGVLPPNTCKLATDLFSDDSIDPEVLLEVLTRASNANLDKPLREKVDAEKVKWEEATSNALFRRLLSHFYRELDDFVYLAPRIRRGFLEAADGKFISLGEPLADLLDWTAMIGEQILNRIELFPSGAPAILRVYGPLRSWNAMLVRLNQLVSVLSPMSNLVSGQFVQKLNLGLLDLPKTYEDDNILFEVNTEEGDTLALSCYYAIFTRNGSQHFSVPLYDYMTLKIETAKTSDSTKTVLVTDPRYGQTLLQGTTGILHSESKRKDKLFFIDSFQEVASLLAQIHECIDWAIRHEDELFSIFFLLHSVAEKLSDHREPKRSLRQTTTPKIQQIEEDFEVVDEQSDNPVVDDEFEIIASDDSDVARNQVSEEDTQ